MNILPGMFRNKGLLFILFFLFQLSSLWAQTRDGRITVSGHITDRLSGETLIGAGVVLEGGTGAVAGAVTNPYGFYTLTLPRGTARLHYSYVGYEGVVLELDLQRDTVINTALSPAEIREATVVASRDAGIESTYLGAVDVPLAQIRNTPVLFGEADVLKAIQMMPGVQGGNEGFTGIYVRGGGPDENLFLLDGVPVYNVDHMFGLFSVFQPEAVKKVTLYKGSFPARYGGRVSGILDVRTNDGNMKETHGSVGIGVISDKLHLEGPIIKDRLSYSVSARGTHTLLYSPVIKLALPKGKYGNYYFYDTSAKLTWRISDRDRLFAGFYKGRDKFVFRESDSYDAPEISGGTEYRYTTRDGINMNWGNTVASLRWNHIFGPRLFSNATAAFNTYSMKMGFSSLEKGVSEGIPYTYKFDVDYISGIRDWSAKYDFDFTPVPDHLIKFGTEYIFHTFRPENLSTIEMENGEKTVGVPIKLFDNKDYYGHDLSVYAEDDWKIGDRLTFNPGVHLTLFMTKGRAYASVQPRVNARYALDSGLSFKAGYSRMSQYVHLLSSAQISLPIDLWVPITKEIKPVVSDQYSAGAYYGGLKGWEFSLEGYWKSMRNILEYKDGTILIASTGGWEEKVEMGTGRAFGMEVFIQKTAGRLTGWLGYTLARTDRQFKDGSINGGKRFPYKYDRRHDLGISLNWEASRKVDFNLTWSFATGGATTLPLRRSVLVYPTGRIDEFDYVSARNNYRLPPSHRLNVGMNVHRYHRKGEGLWNFGVYNVYNAMNPNFVFLTSETVREPGSAEYKYEVKLKKITVLPIIPSISYTRSF